MDERVMVTFEQGDRRFGLRTVAVILDRERKRVVIHRASHEDFWTLPGGRVALRWERVLPKPSCAKCARKWE